MVRDHYARLGFTVMDTDAAGGNRNMLDLASFTPAETFIHVVEGLSRWQPKPRSNRDLTEIFHDVFMRDDIELTPDLTAKRRQGWDSFKQIEIIMACEEKWGIKFNTRELDALRCVGDLAAMVGKKSG